MSTAPTKTLSKGKAKELNGLVEQLMQLGSKEFDTVGASLEQHRDMYGLLERIRRLEPKLRTTNGRQRMENVENFTKWLSKNKCTIGNVRIAEHSEFGGMGLESTGPIETCESFIEVPRSLFFYVKNEAPFKKLLELMPGAMIREQGNIMLALALIMERSRKDSFWKPYFDVLPDRYTTPLYYTPEDMNELNQTDASIPALKLCKSIIRQYGFIRKFVQDKVDDLRSNFTYDIFRWAVSTVMTRQNKVPVNLAGFEGLEFTLALIPYWDMANHAYPATNGSDDKKFVAQTAYNTETETLECWLHYGSCPASGAPIFIMYGKRTDVEFLVHNGFAIPNNKEASVRKPFRLNQEDRLYKERCNLLKLLNMPTQGVFAFGYPKIGKVSPELITLSRVSVMDEKELHDYTTGEPARRNELSIDFSFQPTYLVYRTTAWLAIVMRTFLQAYPTTIEQDEALLKANRQMHHIRRLLIEYRLLEKKMLHGYIEEQKAMDISSLGQAFDAGLFIHNSSNGSTHGNA